MSLHDIYAGTAVEIRDSSRLDVTMNEINEMMKQIVQKMNLEYFSALSLKELLEKPMVSTGAFQVPFVHNEPEH